MHSDLVACARLAGFFLIVLLSSCSQSGPGALFGKRSPHQLYAHRLQQAGLSKTAMGTNWVTVAEQSLTKPSSIKLPYRETGYFSSEEVKANTFTFAAKRGEQLTVELTKKPGKNFAIYMDVWENRGDNNYKLLAYADSTGNPLKYDIEDDASYILRLQPELLSSGEYTVSITTGPSLAYPIISPGKNNIQSFFGDGRDGNNRKHEGVDLFSSFRTPVIASAPGVITRVNQNNLGGNVVWLRPDGKNFTLYYAHLDTQLVTDGQLVQIGDTLGLMGNTGNARTTAPHLHFGIYTFGGAVDPLPFIKPVQAQPARVVANTASLGSSVRTVHNVARLYPSARQIDKGSRILKKSTLLKVEAAASNFYRVTLPDGFSGYVSSSAVVMAKQSLRKVNLLQSGSVYDKPDSTAARKAVLNAGESVDLLGTFDNYNLVRSSKGVVGWLSK